MWMTMIKLGFAIICAEKGEVISDNYKLLPIDLRDVESLNELISAHMDPRYVLNHSV